MAQRKCQNIAKGTAQIASLIARILAAPDDQFKQFKPFNRYAPFKPPTSFLPGDRDCVAMSF